MDDAILGSATLGSRGQITIPKQIRDALFLTEGSRIEFRANGGEVTLSAGRPSADPLDKWFGKYPIPPEPGETEVDVVRWVRRLRGWEDGENEF